MKQTVNVESKEGKKKCVGGEQELPSGKKKLKTGKIEKILQKIVESKNKV